MKKVGTCTLHASKSRAKGKEYIKWMVWLPKPIGDYFEKGTKFEVYINGRDIILSADGKAELKGELYEALLDLFIRAFRDPEVGRLLREKFPEDVALIISILRKMKGGESE